MPAISFWRFLVSNCQDLNYLSLVWFSGILHNRFFVQVIHRESTIEFFLLWLDQKLFSDSWITSNAVSWSKIYIDRLILFMQSSQDFFSITPANFFWWFGCPIKLILYVFTAVHFNSFFIFVKCFHEGTFELKKGPFKRRYYWKRGCRKIKTLWSYLLYCIYKNTNG